MRMSCSLIATAWSHPPARTRHGGKQGHPGTAPTGDIQSVNVQHMYPPTTSHDVRPTSTAEYRLDSKARHSTQGRGSACSLGGESHMVHMVPPHGDCGEGKRRTTPSCGLPTKFVWTNEHQEAFEASKQEIIEQIQTEVEIFEKDRTTCIATDWSKSGIGFWMFQRHCSCPQRELFCCKEGWRITLVGSRFTHAAESRYAAIEGEALVVAEALQRCRHFILGCTDLFIAVDHKPLVRIFGDRALADISNARLRNLKEKTLPYSFKMVYIPGVHNCTSDALSRHPSGTHKPPGMSLPDAVSAPPPRIPLSLMAGLSVETDTTTDKMDENNLVHSMCSALESMLPLTWQRLKEETTSDDTMQLLLSTIEEGFPLKQADVPLNIRPFFIHRPHLYTVDGVAVFKDRVVIPPSLRAECLQALHSAHQGTTMMQSRADASVFWPGIAADIAHHRATCTMCNTMSPSQASLPPTRPPPFQRGHSKACALTTSTTRATPM